MQPDQFEKPLVPMRSAHSQQHLHGSFPGNFSALLIILHKVCRNSVTKRVSSGKLTKDKINARGYNKYLTLKNEVNVEIDYAKFEADAKWDGLKGYITNTTLSADAVIDSYSNLWHIEKAFRMSKSDLQIRPIYHFTKRRIEAHISISFVAYTIYKELERLLYKHEAPFSVKTARDIVKNMYQIEIELPNSKHKEKVLLNMDDEQKFLLNIVQSEFG